MNPADQFPSLLSKVSTSVLIHGCQVHFKWLTLICRQQILDNIPKDVDSRSVTLSNKPFGGEDRLLSSLKGVAIERVGLR